MTRQGFVNVGSEGVLEKIDFFSVDMYVAHGIARQTPPSAFPALPMSFQLGMGPLVSQLKDFG